MDASVCIKQKGTVEEIKNHRIRVRIHRDSACGQCNAIGFCNLSDVSERIIETNDNAQNLKIGDHVDVTISRNMGNKAVILGYLLPFLLLIAVLFFLNALAIEEWLSGLISLATLAPYYMLLYLFRDKLRKSFTFTIRKEEL
jgi:sigma-E factor negative regulatory protein RseC